MDDKEELLLGKLNELLFLFKDSELVSGKVIVDNFWRLFRGEDDKISVSDFFEFYTKEILTVNPGHSIKSQIWIYNDYGLSLEWRRELKLREILK